MSKVEPRSADDFSDFISESWDDKDCRVKAKKEDVAITLTGMLYHQGISRAELGRILNWKKSRVTRALSGAENLTIKTLYEIIDAVGYDFDIVLRAKDKPRELQLYEKHSEPTYDISHMLVAHLDNAIKLISATVSTAVSEKTLVIPPFAMIAWQNRTVGEDIDTSNLIINTAFSGQEKVARTAYH